MTWRDVLAGTALWSCDGGPVLPYLRSLPDASVHCVATSPPYYGLRSYLPAGHPDKAHEIGTEASPAEYVARMVEVFEECRRVLHPSGVLWLNIGDSYANDAKGPGSRKGPGCQGRANVDAVQKPWRGSVLKKKDLIGVPWMLAFALRDAGWWLRAENIWGKPNGMMESVTDRPARAHEQVFLFSKSHRYFYDTFATRQPAKWSASGNKARKFGDDRGRPGNHLGASVPWAGDTALLRSVWTISVARSKEAHFAVMPDALAARCVLAGTSEHGVCSGCGEPWRRLTRKTRMATRPGEQSKAKVAIVGGRGGKVIGNRDPQRHVTRVEHVDWQAGCNCGERAVPAVVLDPFAGTGTTLRVAAGLGRRAIGCDLNLDHAATTHRRLAGEIPNLIGV